MRGTASGSYFQMIPQTKGCCLQTCATESYGPAGSEWWQPPVHHGSAGPPPLATLRSHSAPAGVPAHAHLCLFNMKERPKAFSCSWESTGQPAGLLLFAINIGPLKDIAAVHYLLFALPICLSWPSQDICQTGPAFHISPLWGVSSGFVATFSRFFLTTPHPLERSSRYPSAFIYSIKE